MLLYSIMGTVADTLWLLRDFSDQREGLLRSSLVFFLILLLLCKVSHERDYRVITERTIYQNCLLLHLLGSLFLTIVMSNWMVINDESKRDANSGINIAKNLENITGQSRLSA
jgi:predicted membrane protein